MRIRLTWLKTPKLLQTQADYPKGKEERSISAQGIQRRGNSILDQQHKGAVGHPALSYLKIAPSISRLQGIISMISGDTFS